MNLASSYYYKPRTAGDGWASRDAELKDHIERIQEEFPGYGYRRLGRQLAGALAREETCQELGAELEVICKMLTALIKGTE